MGPAEKNLEKIHDLNCVAYLTISGFPIIDIQSEGEAVVFCFKKSPAFRGAILRYLSHDARIDPLSFAEQIRNLRAVVRDKYSDLTEKGRYLFRNRSPRGKIRVWHNEEHPEGRRSG